MENFALYTPRSNLSTLPVELLCMILRHLGFKDILRCRLVCKPFNGLIVRDPLLVYRVRLALNGLEDSDDLNSGYRSFSLVDRIHLLERYRNGWNSLNPGLFKLIPVAKDKSTRGHGYKQFPPWNVASYMLYPDTLCVLQLPSKLRGIAAHMIISHKMTTKLVNYAIDFANDLLVVAEKSDVDSESTVHLRFRNLQTGKIIPDLSISDLRSTSYPGMENCDLELWSVYLVCRATPGDRNSSTSLRIWNWKQGVLLLDLEDHEMTFIFLTDHQVLLAGGDREFLGVLDLRTLNGQSADSMEEIDYVCRLLLPEPDHSEESDEILTDVFCELKSNFGYSRSPYADITGNLSPARVVPIHADPSQRIIILEFHIMEGVDERRSSLVIPLSTILSCFDLQGLTSNRTLEWKLWGPQGTRYFRCVDENDADNIYGSRWMTCYRPSDETATISIFDFNQRVVRRRLPFTESDGDVARKLKSGEWVLVTLPNTIRPDADSPFAESVTTALPFLLREMFLPEPMNHFHQRPNSISLTEDAIFFTVIKPGLENVEDKQYALLV